ncbi:MAG: penicillin-binding protein 2 [Armatimonas sp.]
MGRGGLHLRNRIPLERAPVEAPEMGQERIWILGGITLLGLLTLIGRFWYLQVAHGDSYLDEAKSNQRASVRIAPPRGIIEDRNGVALLTNTSRIDVFMTPNELGDWVEKEVRVRRKALKKEKKSLGEAEVKALYKEVQRAAFQKLADRLEVPVDPLLKEFEKNRLGTSEPARVFAGATQAQLARVAEHLAELPGVTPMVVPVRQYPKGKLAAQILGYVDQISENALKQEQAVLAKADAEGQDTDDMPRHRPGDLIGTYGLEKYYDRLLSGKEGSIDYLVNAQQERLSVADEQKAIPGAKLTLTFDWKLQALAEKLMQGKKGAAVAIDPRTGGILAMCSYPSFDPAVFQKRPIAPEVFKEVSQGQLNRAVSGFYPPGSTFKIVSSIAGLAEGKIDTGTTFTCGGSYLKLKCDGVHGGVSLGKALTVSCDTYYYHVGQRLGEEKLKTWAQNMGLGQKTGIDLPHQTFGTPGGYLSTSKAKERSIEGQLAQAKKAGNQALIAKLEREPRYLGLGETMQTAIGQGLTAVSPLQMAQVASAVANRGTIYRPHFLKKATTSDGTGKVLDIDEAKSRVAHEIKLSSYQWNAIQQGLRAVVTTGTARATVNSKFVYIAGKTGTAEKNKLGDNYAWLICYASRKPGEQPTIAVAVAVEPLVRGQHGSDMAGPIARRIVEGHFGIGLTNPTNEATETVAPAGGD